MKPRSKFMFHILTLFALLASLAGSAVFITPAYAASFVVTTAADTDDGVCNAGCSLREAITAANANGAGADTITFAANYTITLTDIQLPTVTTTITINGKGASNTIIEASTCNPVTLPGGCTPAAYRVLEVGTTTGNLTLNGLTIRHGNCGGSCVPDGPVGGGIYNNAGALTVSNVTFSANSASNGGGMYNSGSLTLTNVTFSANSASLNGGGMYNFHSSPTLTNVTFSGNSAASGGGMYNLNSSPALMNVTFSANSTTYGGGMYNISSSNPTLTNVTFSANSAASGGGGMYNSSSSPRLTNTLIANSTSGGDCVNSSSTLNAASSNNLIESAANACGLTNGGGGNIVGSDPNLDALADNGGYTQTHALLSGSLAIDAGKNTVCPFTDQRGMFRPQGGICDIGSFEFASGGLFILFLPLILR